MRLIYCHVSCCPIQSAYSYYTFFLTTHACYNDDLEHWFVTKNISNITEIMDVNYIYISAKKNNLLLLIDKIWCHHYVCCSTRLVTKPNILSCHLVIVVNLSVSSELPNRHWWETLWSDYLINGEFFVWFLVWFDL